VDDLKLTRLDMATLVQNSSLSPAGKRKALAKLGVDTEYQPHQGKRETERRKRQHGAAV
jgi:hypothetical protein